MDVVYRKYRFILFFYQFYVVEVFLCLGPVDPVSFIGVFCLFKKWSEYNKILNK